MVVKIDNLVKKYGNLTAVNNLNLEVDDGEIFGLLGPNGCGKSTTINCLLALLKYDKGNITVFGKKMTPSAYSIKKDIGVILQNVAVFNELTVYQNIDYFCSLYIKDKAKRNQCVQEAIEFVGLTDFKKFLPKKLSGGLLRRLNIACGIAHKPKLIILDEPTVAVDPQSRNNILEGIKKLNENGSTIIYTTHYMEEVEEICTRVVIMDKGQIIAQGTVPELKQMVTKGKTVKADIKVLSDKQLEQIKKLQNIAEATYENKILTVKTIDKTSVLPELVEFFTTNDIEYGDIFSKLPTLNDVFLKLTGKELRD